MKNITVKEFVEFLKEMDQDAVICSVEMEDMTPIYKSLKMFEQLENVHYFSDTGSFVKGNIVTIN